MESGEVRAIHQGSPNNTAALHTTTGSCRSWRGWGLGRWGPGTASAAGSHASSQKQQRICGAVKGNGARDGVAQEGDGCQECQAWALKCAVPRCVSLYHCAEKGKAALVSGVQHWGEHFGPHEPCPPPDFAPKTLDSPLEPPNKHVQGCVGGGRNDK